MNGVGPQFIPDKNTLAQSPVFQNRRANTAQRPTAVTGNPLLAAAPRRRPAAPAPTFPRQRKYDASMQRLAAWRVFLCHQQGRRDLSNGAQRTLEHLSSSARGYLPIDSLSWFKRKGVLKAHDPIHNLGLTDSSVFYRAMKAERVQDGAIEGNPRSDAKIKNYMVLTKYDFGNFFKNWHYIPKRMRASDLPDPSLNVMYGTEAISAASMYAKEGSVVVQMTLGDIRRATNGKAKIFFDTSAVVGGGAASEPLIIAVPEGRNIPVRIVPTQ